MPNTLISWIWWFFSTVLIAIIINFFTEYSRPKIDKILGRYSNKQKEKNEKYNARIMALAKEIYSKSELSLYYYSAKTFWDNYSLISLLVSVVVGIADVPILSLITIVSVKGTREISSIYVSLETFLRLYVIVFVVFFACIAAAIMMLRASYWSRFYADIIYKYKEMIEENKQVE
ncbi:MAG: hypothetical protein U0V02_17440 [Anaerolineales bacterium]